MGKVGGGLDRELFPPSSAVITPHCMGKGEEMNGKKIWTWVKDFGGWIIAGILSIITFGSVKSAKRLRSNIDKLRSDNAELIRQLEQAGREVEQLRSLDKLDEASYRQLRTHVDNASKDLGQLRESNSDNADNLDLLTENNRRLRAWIESYREQLEAMENGG